MDTRAWTVTALKEMGFTVLPSQTNFLFVSRPGRSGKELLDGLRARGVLVRWWADEPIRDWLRGIHRHGRRNARAGGRAQGADLIAL